MLVHLCILASRLSAFLSAARLRFFAPVVFSAACAPLFAAGSGVRYIEPPEGTGHISVWVVADEGRLLAGQMGQTSWDGKAWFWTTEGGIEFINVDIDPPRPPQYADEVIFSRVQGASSDGRFLVGRIEAGNGHTVAFRHDRETGETRLAAPPEDLTPRPESPTVLSRAVAVSDDGRYMVGQMRVGDRNEAVYWDWEADPEGGEFWSVIPVYGAWANSGFFPIDVTLDPWAYGVSADGRRMMGFATVWGHGYVSKIGFTFEREAGVVRFLSSGWHLHHVPAAAEVEIPAEMDIWGFSADGSTVVGSTVVPDVDNGLRLTATRWNFDWLSPEFLGIPEGWDWTNADSVSADGAVITGYGGRPAAGGYEVSGVFWTAESGFRSIHDYIASEWGYDLRGGGISRLSVSPDGKRFAGILEGEHGPSVILFPRLPFQEIFGGGLVSRGNGSWMSEWFGEFSVAGGGWVDHAEHGRIYPHGASGQGTLLFDSSMNVWTWTGDDAYPWMYAYGSDDQWVWYVPGGTPEGRWFYYLEDENWVFHGDAGGSDGGYGYAPAPDVLAAGSFLRFEGTFTENGFSDTATLDVRILTPATASVTYTEPNEGFSIGPVTLPFTYEVAGVVRARFSYGAGDPDFSGELNLRFTSQTEGTVRGTQRDEGYVLALDGTFVIE